MDAEEAMMITARQRRARNLRNAGMMTAEDGTIVERRKSERVELFRTILEENLKLRQTMPEPALTPSKRAA
jgi:hypothetical protein